MSSSLSPAKERRRERFDNESGFTLVEVLVAFTVMAMLLSVLFRGVVTVRAGSVAFDDHTHREILARAVLDDALAERELAPGHYGGVREGIQWTLVAKPIDLTAQLPSPIRDDVAGSARREGGGSEGGAPTSVKDAIGTWSPQRLVVRIETNGTPLEIETIRLVKGGQRP